MTDHEKRIREALAECSADGDTFALISTADLRALLADLDAVRGALKLMLAEFPEEITEGEKHARANAIAALKGASHD